MLTIPNNRRHISWSIYIQRWNRLYTSITVQQTNLLQLLCPVLLTLSKSSHEVYFFFVSIQRLCLNQAFLTQNALLSALGKNAEGWYPEFSTTIIFVSTAKWNGRLCTRKCLACLYEHLGVGFDSFLNRKVTFRWFIPVVCAIIQIIVNMKRCKSNTTKYFIMVLWVRLMTTCFGLSSKLGHHQVKT